MFVEKYCNVICQDSIVGFLGGKDTHNMLKSELMVIFTGIVMIITGLVLFYSIQTGANTDTTFRMFKHAGTFVGLMGIGVSIAGMLLTLISRNQPLPYGEQER